jgi:hypothetical protein
VAKKRCGVTFQDGQWRVTFEGVLRTRARAFRTETQAYMAMTEWSGLQRAKGQEVELAFANATVAA